MKPFAIIIKTWNKEDVRFFDSLEEAQTEWNKICNHRHALKTDGGKNVCHTNPRLGYWSNFYYKTSYQASWL